MKKWKSLCLNRIEGSVIEVVGVSLIRAVVDDDDEGEDEEDERLAN